MNNIKSLNVQFEIYIKYIKSNFQQIFQMRRNLNRRVVLVIICSFSGILLLFNICTSSMSGVSLQGKGNEENITLDNVRAVKSISEPKDPVKLQTVEAKPESTSVKITNINSLPWYFKDGSLLSHESNITRKSFQKTFQINKNKKSFKM